MGYSAQAGLDAAQHDGAGGLEEAPDQVRVDDGGSIGAAVIHPTWRIVIASAALLQGSIVGDHRVNASG